ERCPIARSRARSARGGRRRAAHLVGRRCRGRVQGKTRRERGELPRLPGGGQRGRGGEQEDRGEDREESSPHGTSILLARPQGVCGASLEGAFRTACARRA